MRLVGPVPIAVYEEDLRVLALTPYRERRASQFICLHSHASPVERVACPPPPQARPLQVWTDVNFQLAFFLTRNMERICLSVCA